MKKRLGIIDLNEVFFNKAKIILKDKASVEQIDAAEELKPERFDLIFTSAYSEHASNPHFVTFGEGGDYPLPCLHDDILAALEVVKQSQKDRPLLYLEEKTAYLGGKAIALTKKEAKLLEILLGAKENGITNFEIHEKYPFEFCDYNSLKVYVNYLRKKLEADGDKIIFSMRIPGGCKYYVHDKYWRVHYAYPV